MLSLPVLLLAGLATLLPAQGVRGLFDSGGAAREVDAEQVLSVASESFAAAVDRALGGEASDGRHALAGADELDPERRRALGRDAREGFQLASEQRLSELQGDGLLHAEEATAALAELRAAGLVQLEDAVRAFVAGFEPPPRREDFRTNRAHDVALARYVFLERNSWIAWLKLIGAVLGGFTLAVGVLKASTWKLESTQGLAWKRPVLDVIDRLHGPFYVLLASGGLALGLRAVWLPHTVHEPVRISVLFLAVVAVFWALWRLAASAVQRVGNWATPDGESPGEQVLEILGKVLRIGLILLFAFLAVEILFGTDLTALLAGLGLIGVAVTLAAQDTLKDLFAALTIHLNQPFALGDLVRFSGHFGTVESIGFRMTRIRTIDGHLVTVPNAKLISEPLENVGARPHVRRRFYLDLPYNTPVEQVKCALDIVREVIREAGDLDSEQEVQVHFEEFGAHSLRVLVQYYFGSGDYWAAKQKATEIDLALLERLRAADIEFAFPTQTLHLFREDEPQADRHAADADEPQRVED